ncbi:MAG: hypothetical protein H6599_10700 [Flavobacteriales bacterium]|nr:hypothetical protein [Flavobacteriales bacterium]
MKIKIFNIFLFIVLLVFNSCTNAESVRSSEIVNETEMEYSVVLEKGYLYKPTLESLQFFTYSRNITDSNIIHSYKIDSMIQFPDSSILVGKDLGWYENNELTFLQSTTNGSLKWIEDFHDSLSYFEQKLDLKDSIEINANGVEYKIYKYEISNPDLDGDLTIFLNSEFGVIEWYNQSWALRRTIKTHSQIPGVFSELVSTLKEGNKSFYLQPLYKGEFKATTKIQ